jgi:hypothetical protein
LKKALEDLDKKVDKVDVSETKGSKIISLLKTGLIGGISGGGSKFLVYPLVRNHHVLLIGNCVYLNILIV